MAPGVYRETGTIGSSGGSSYTTGTVSVTQGSAIVTGSGTSFTGNAFVAGVFRIHKLASGTDGVTNGTATFTSAAGNFQSSMIGCTIRINTKAAYIISAVGSATSITLKNPDGSAPAPTSATALTYDVGPESPYEIASVDSNTQLTLTRPWTGPTLTGVAYETWNPVSIIGDVTGVETDGVGGVVRVTGSDNDQTATRSAVITATSKNYVTIRGLTMDTSLSEMLTTLTCTNWIIEDCSLSHSSGDLITTNGATQANYTIRRCFLFDAKNFIGIHFTHSSTVNNAGHLVENCLVVPGTRHYGINSTRIGGITVRNCTVYGCENGIIVLAALSAGQAMTVNNCNVFSCNTGLYANTTAEYIEDYNNVFSCGVARNSVTTGSNSKAYSPLLAMPLLYAGVAFPWVFGALSQWSLLAARAGIMETGLDLFGLARPTTSAKKSWGPVQYNPWTFETGTVDAGTGSRKLSDAGRSQQYRVPVTNVSTTISVKVRRQTDYAGTLPQMVIKQPGQADITVTDTGSANAWNVLTTTFTPAATPPWITVEIVSSNTATSGSFACFWDTGAVS